jgi:hypothetical protein
MNWLTMSQTYLESLVQWCTPVVPTTQEAEAGGLLETRSLRPAWTTKWDLVSKRKGNFWGIKNLHLIPLLGIYPNECESGYNKGTCIPMFIAALFTIAKLWKQPRCPTTGECINKLWYLYTMEFYSATKNNESLLFTCKWMELENTILSDDVAKRHMLSIICGI